MRLSLNEADLDEISNQQKSRATVLLFGAGVLVLLVIIGVLVMFKFTDQSRISELAEADRVKTEKISDLEQRLKAADSNAIEAKAKLTEAEEKLAAQKLRVQAAEVETNPSGRRVTGSGNDRPDPEFTFDSLRSLLTEKTPAQVQSILGPPDRVSDSGTSIAWTYEGIAYDAVTGQISSFTRVWFKCYDLGDTRPCFVDRITF